MADNTEDKGANYNLMADNFSDSEVPEMNLDRAGKYYRFGEDDDYPIYLLYLLDKSSKHNAIVGNKSDYIFGGGLKYEEANDDAVKFATKYEDLVEKLIVDVETFGGYYVQCIPTKGGQWAFYHMSFPRLRRSECLTKFLYKKNWVTGTSRSEGFEEPKTFPAFDPTKRVVSVMMYKEYRPGNRPYALPNFMAACNWIESDVEVSKTTLTNAKTGFSASKFINFFNGEPEQAAKKIIEEKFMGKYGGSQGRKMIISFNQAAVKEPTVQDLGPSDLTKEDFEHTDDLISTNIYAGHKVTNSALFGIPQGNHSLGGNSGAELKAAYELFKNTYVAKRKAKLEKQINIMAGFTGVVSPAFTLIDVPPIGLNLSEASLLKVAPRSYILEQLGIDITKYTDAPVDASGAAGVAPSAQKTDEGVNSVLRDLSAKQTQHLNRLIRQHTKGQLTESAALLLMQRSFGLSLEESRTLLGLDDTDKFSSDEDVAELFAAHGESASVYEAYEPRIATFDAEYDDIVEKIKAARKKDSKATAEQIAESIGVDVKVVKSYINSLKTAGTVLPKFEVRYSYEKRPDATGNPVIAGTRPFCRKMLSLNKLYSRADIQKISEYLGYDVMKRAGGFWNDNGDVKYHCRHEFMSHIVIKKAK